MHGSVDYGAAVLACRVVQCLRSLVPVKAFRSAKRRLAEVLPDADRAELARRDGRPRSSPPLRPLTGLRRVRRRRGRRVGRRARAHGAVAPRARPQRRRHATAWRSLAERASTRRRRRPRRPAARPATSSPLRSDPGSITLVPDRHDDGTNVLALPADVGFRFAYGPGSFRHHLAEAAQPRPRRARVARPAARPRHRHARRPRPPARAGGAAAWLPTNPANRP